MKAEAPEQWTQDEGELLVMVMFMDCRQIKFCRKRDTDFGVGEGESRR